MNINKTAQGRSDIIATLEGRIANLEKSRDSYKKEAEKYRSIFDNAVLGIFQLSPEGRLLNANHAAATLLGYDCIEEFLSEIQYISEIYPYPEEREPALVMLREQGFIKNYEVRNRRKDGSIIWVSANARMIFDERGDPLYYEGTVQDISERKKMEDDLRESRKLSRILLDAPLDYILFLMNPNGIVLDASESLPRRLNVKFNDLMGKNIYDFLPDNIAQFRRGYHQEILETKRTVHFEDENDGHSYDNAGYPILDEKGNVDKIVVFMNDITQRKNAEEERDRILQNSPDLICVAGFDGYFKYVNPAWEKVLGYSIEEFMTRPLVDFTYHEDHSKSLEQLRKLAESQTSLELTNRCVHKDGSIRIFMWILTPMIEKNVAYCIGRDVTEWKAAEDKLVRSEQRFRSYFELPLVGIGITSPEKIWVSVNDRLCEIFGYSREELVLMEWTENTHPDDLPGNIEHYLTILEGNNDTYFGEKRYVRKNGEVIWATISVGWVRKPSGELDHGIVIVQDITDRKVMEEELREYRDRLEKLVSERTIELKQEIIRRQEKEEQLLALVESVIEWIWETDESTKHTYISPRVYDILGYRPEEMIGKHLFDFLSYPEKKRIMPVLIKIIAGRKSFTALQCAALHKNGTTVLFEGSGIPFYDKDGKFLGYRGSCRDITQQKETMDILQRHERELLAKSETLKETNAALKVLLKQRDKDKDEMAEKFISNIKEMILPYISKMKKERVEPRHKAYLDIITTNLNELMSPFVDKVRQFNFTPKEIEVASLVKDGRTTKDIAEIMGIATSAVDSHRNNIRNKLGLINKDVNLRTYLLSFKDKTQR
jgi:PAS domain S-box-containing protein